MDDWRTSAACSGLTPHLFDDDADDPLVIANPLVRVTRREAAAAICATCPVREECLADSLKDSKHGGFTTIRAGLTGWQRARLGRAP